MSDRGKAAWQRNQTALVLALAVIAAVVATGLIAGMSMWAWIVGYWLVLAAKNTLEAAGRRKDADG